jgi:hypothetical protein
VVDRLRWGFDPRYLSIPRTATPLCWPCTPPRLPRPAPPRGVRSALEGLSPFRANGLPSALGSFSASSPISRTQNPAKPDRAVSASRNNPRVISSSFPSRRAYLPPPDHLRICPSVVGSALRSASSSSVSQPVGNLVGQRYRRYGGQRRTRQKEGRELAPQLSSLIRIFVSPLCSDLPRGPSVHPVALLLAEARFLLRSAVTGREPRERQPAGVSLGSRVYAPGCVRGARTGRRLSRFFVLCSPARGSGGARLAPVAADGGPKASSRDGARAPAPWRAQPPGCDPRPPAWRSRA